MKHEFRALAKGVVGGEYVFDEFEAKTMIWQVATMVHLNLLFMNNQFLLAIKILLSLFLMKSLSL